MTIVVVSETVSMVNNRHCFLFLGKKNWRVICELRKTWAVQEAKVIRKIRAKGPT